MIYRVYSDFISNDRIQNAIKSWNRENIKNIGVKNEDLTRLHYGFPYLKDLLDFGYFQCENDDDIILYTNADIGLVSDFNDFPNKNFICVRKNVNEIKSYKKEELSEISYEPSINCDCFGITKKWYQENREKIPDFVIGSPKWDIAMIILLNTIRINNVIFHVKHDSVWKNERNQKKHSYNKDLYFSFLKENNIPFFDNDKNEIMYNCYLKYMAEKHGFSYFKNPKFITFYTPSHQKMHDELFLKSYKLLFKDELIHESLFFEDQLCKTAIYHEKGWRKTQIQKFKHILNCIKTIPKNGIFIFCDSDIILIKDFLKDIEKYLYDYDIVTQNAFSRSYFERETSQHCSGFFIGRANDNVKNLISKIILDLETEKENDSHGDQYFLNKNSNMAKIKNLDETYFNIGLLTRGGISSCSFEFNHLVELIPENVKIIHANYILSASNKYNFLEKAYHKFIKDK
jgi:hypothetical protein